jgi:hypothetical protein
LLAGLAQPANAADGETREAKHSSYKDEGVFNKPGMTQPCKQFSRHEIRLVFPVAGGPVKGTWKFAFRAAVDLSKSTGPIKDVLCVGGGDEDPTSYEITGTYDGKDGGTIRATCTDLKKKESKPCGGRIFASGTGTFKEDEDSAASNRALSFPPFGSCNTDLNAYEKELRNQLLNALIDTASKYTFTKLRSAGNELRGWTREMYVLWKIRTDAYDDLLDPLWRKPPLSVFERMENQVMKVSMGPGAAGHLEELPIWKVVREVGENASKGMGALQLLNSFVEGDYTETVKTVVFEAIGSYSNVAGLAITAAQATYADWQAFERRYQDKEFKELYRLMYYDKGGRPMQERWKAERKVRLRHFVEEVYDWLDYSDTQGPRLRRLLVNYAADKLELRLSQADFRLKDTESGGRTLADPRAVATLGALFLEFENVFEKDVEAELLRQLSERAAKRMADRAQKAQDGLKQAATGDFAGVWPDAEERTNQLCKVIQKVQADYRAKPGGPSDTQDHTATSAFFDDGLGFLPCLRASRQCRCAVRPGLYEVPDQRS